jgi:CheY-like chemotaxis protein
MSNPFPPTAPPGQSLGVDPADAETPTTEVAVASSDHDARRSPLPRGAETILVVEDDDDVRRGLRAILEELGYVVLDAPDAAIAFREVEGHSGPVDLILVDVVLSGIGMSGRVLVDQLRAAGHAMKVLFMSGHTDKVVREYGVDEGAEPLLRKAFSPSDLARTVRRIMDGTQAARTTAA